MKTNLTSLISILILVLGSSVILFSQTTEFTYQGSLRDGASPASGNYDFEFLLFDAAAGGMQLGSTLARNAVAVTGGTFAVNLDFGANFPGANRFIEIRVRQTGGGAYTPLVPRQQVNSAPYSVKAVNADTAVNATNATMLGGLPASGYIQNTSSPQAGSNFNVSGNGTVGGNLQANQSLTFGTVLTNQNDTLFVDPGGQLRATRLSVGQPMAEVFAVQTNGNVNATGLYLAGNTIAAGNNVASVNGSLTVTGNFVVTGSKSAVVKLANGRDVLLYAMESPENWFEDFGTIKLRRGRAIVRIDRTFAETTNVGVPYKVFLTPNGNCRGLYVTRKNASSFEIRELGGGRSSVSIDYRIVARRRGYEKERFAPGPPMRP